MISGVCEVDEAACLGGWLGMQPAVDKLLDRLLVDGQIRNPSRHGVLSPTEAALPVATATIMSSSTRG